MPKWANGKMENGFDGMRKQKLKD